jgi:mannobiose 2-epimerase
MRHTTIRFISALFLVMMTHLCIRMLAADLPTLSREYVPKLEKNLQQNIVPFWLSKTLDAQNGGYTLNFGLKGEPLGPGVKMIVTQSRQLWLFSRLVREGYGGAKELQAAALGYRFLREKMWDQKNGGFFWQVDPSGNKVLFPAKVLYGQSFGLYAVSEYYLASHKQEVLQFANQIFEVLEKKAHDAEYGGFQETFSEDWKPATLGNNYMNPGKADKLMNTHLHLMEALTAYYRASRLPLARERLMELLTIESNSVVRKQVGACTDKYFRDWTPLLDADTSRVSYGHDLENIWLIIDACDAVGISPYPYQDLFKTLFAYSAKYGFDAKLGGFFSSGDQFNQPANDRNKVWWVQAEALVSCLYMHRLTGDPRYLDYFTKTYRFVEIRQTDWENGEWHATITPDGKPMGQKANPWKGGYHNGRAMMECLLILKKGMGGGEKSSEK